MGLGRGRHLKDAFGPSVRSLFAGGAPAPGSSAQFLFLVSLEAVGISRSEMVELVVAGFEV